MIKFRCVTELSVIPETRLNGSHVEWCNIVQNGSNVRVRVNPEVVNHPSSSMKSGRGVNPPPDNRRKYFPRTQSHRDAPVAALDPRRIGPLGLDDHPHVVLWAHVMMTLLSEKLPKSIFTKPCSILLMIQNI